MEETLHCKAPPSSREVGQWLKRDVKEERFMPDERLTLLKRREIEAAFFRALKGPLLEKLTEEELREAAGKAICNEAREAGAAAAREGKSLEDLKRVVALWEEGGALELERVDDEAHPLAFDVTRCVYAELYEAMGLKEWGTLLSCDRDAAFLEGFNEELKLTRSETLMEGKKRCDFRYGPR